MRWWSRAARAEPVDELPRLRAEGIGEVEAGEENLLACEVDPRAEARVVPVAAPVAGAALVPVSRERVRRKPAGAAHERRAADGMAEAADPALDPAGTRARFLYPETGVARRRRRLAARGLGAGRTVRAVRSAVRAPGGGDDR